MMKVERYEVEGYDWQSYRDPEGDWVKFDDYAALHKLAKEMQDKLSYELAGMSATCEHEGCNCGFYWNHDAPEDMDAIAALIARAAELL